MKPTKYSDMDESRFKLQPYTIGEMAVLYHVSLPTFKKWIAPHLDTIGKRIGIYFTTKQVEIIVSILGSP